MKFQGRPFCDGKEPIALNRCNERQQIRSHISKCDSVSCTSTRSKFEMNQRAPIDELGYARPDLEDPDYI